MEVKTWESEWKNITQILPYKGLTSCFSWVWTVCESYDMAFIVIRSEPSWTAMQRFLIQIREYLLDEWCLANQKKSAKEHWSCSCTSLCTNTLLRPLMCLFCSLCHPSVSALKVLKAQNLSLHHLPKEPFSTDTIGF